MRRRERAALAALLLGLAGSEAPRAAAEQEAAAPPLLADEFTQALSQERWQVLRVHDVRSDRVEVSEGSLLVALDTLGTDDETVKLRGVRSRAAFEVDAKQPLRIELVLDWSGQRNGSYLTAGLALVPAGETGAPHVAREALAFEFVGVPPGRNARPSLWRRRAGGLQPLYTEGWPQARREERVGRPVGRVRLAVEVTPERVVLHEDGQPRYDGPGGLAGPVRLVLFVTSHSNYGQRSVRFDDVRVSRP